MTSSVAPIEMSPARDVRTDDESLTVVLADGRVITTPLDWYPRLAHGTLQERARWEPIGDGVAIHWPDLDETIGVEGLIAGHKSGESGPSFKRWLVIQGQLRQMPPGFRERRREVLRVGPLAADEIAKRIRQTIDAWESQSAEWRVGISTDAFASLAVCGVPVDDETVVVYEAADESAARAAERAALDMGLSAATADATIGTPTQVYIYRENPNIGGNRQAS